MFLKLKIKKPDVLSSPTLTVQTIIKKLSLKRDDNSITRREDQMMHDSEDVDLEELICLRA